MQKLKDIGAIGSTNQHINLHFYKKLLTESLIIHRRFLGGNPDLEQMSTYDVISVAFIYKFSKQSKG